jgi:hypothetical protein
MKLKKGLISKEEERRWQNPEEACRSVRTSGRKIED